MIPFILNIQNKQIYRESRSLALAGVAQWIEHRPENQKGHWFDSQSGHMSGLQVRSPVGGVQEAPHTDVSLALFSPPLTCLKINK